MTGFDHKHHKSIDFLSWPSIHWIFAINLGWLGLNRTKIYVQLTGPQFQKSKCANLIAVEPCNSYKLIARRTVNIVGNGVWGMLTQTNGCPGQNIGWSLGTVMKDRKKTRLRQRIALNSTSIGDLLPQYGVWRNPN